MSKDERHEHTWIYDSKGCCYVLICSLPECSKLTKAHHLKGDEPQIGEPVRILDDGDTIERIGSIAI